MPIDLCQYELKAKHCPQPILADVFLSLLKVIQEYISLGSLPESRFEAILDQLSNPVEIKAVVKRKAPARKKAPAAKAGSTSSLIYTPFFWVPTQGPSPSMSDLRDELMPTLCREAAQYLGLEAIALELACEAPRPSVYEMALEKRDSSHIYQATKVFLKTWFLKVVRDKANSDQKTDASSNVKIVTTQRASLLSPNYAQRFGILIFSLKKACGQSATIKDVEDKILSCTLGANEIGLLSESLQNPQENEELKSSLMSIEAFIEAKSYNELYDDEKFLYFISRIPNVKERMCCLYVAATFKPVAEQLTARMTDIRSAINLLALNPRIHKLHKLVLSVGNELNRGHAVRGSLKYFRLSTFDKLVDLKGVDGMSLATYLSHFMEKICDNSDEQRFLNKVALYGVINTYNACKDLINTYLCIAGAHKNSKLIPKNSDEYKTDQYQRTTELAAETLLPDVQSLVQEYYEFVACYTAAAYFFGDPNTLLPLDNATSKASDDDGGSARDLLQRYVAVIELLKPPKRRRFDLMKEEDLPDLLEVPVDKNIPSKVTNSAKDVNQPTRTPARTPARGDPTTASRERIQVEPKTANRPRTTAAAATLGENTLPAQKRAKVNQEGPFAPAVIRPGCPTSRRLLTLRGRIGARGVVPRAPLVMPRADEGRARVSISNSYSLARDLSNPAPAD